MKRALVMAFAAALLAPGLVGCGSDVKDQGVPKNVDMSKDYTPKVEMPGMSPDYLKKGATKSGGSAGGNLAPVK